MTCPSPLPADYLTWERWRLAGGIKAERPVGLRQRIPASWWACLKERRPKPNMTASIWSLPGLFISYGWRVNKWEPGWLVHEARARGFRWIATQAEDTPPDVAAAFCVACRNALIMPIVWESAVDYGSPSRVANGYDGYIGQVEGPGQYERLVSSVKGFRQSFPALPAAVLHSAGIAVYHMDGTLDEAATKASAEPFVAAGFHCIAESWIKTNPQGTPAAVVDYAKRVLGFSTASPMAGLGENGAVLADYPGLDAFPGYSIFAAEELLPS